MKTLHTCLAIIALAILAACTNEPKKTVLNISVNNIQNPQLLFFPPERVSPDTLQISTATPLRIEFDSHEISQVRILYAGAYVPLFVEPGQEYNLTFDKDPEDKTRFSSDNNVQQQYYNLGASRDIYQYEWIRDYTVAPYDTVGSKMLDNFRELIAAEFNIIDTIPMSNAMKKVLQKDTQLYWLAALSKIIRNDYFSLTRSEKESMYSGYMEIWEKIYSEYPLSREYLQSTWLHAYAQAYFYFILAKEYGKEFPSASFSKSEDFWNLQYKTFNNHIADNKVLEKVLAAFLFSDCLNNKTSDKALTVHINHFLKEYPENSNREYFLAYLSELDEYYRIIAKDFSPEVKFVEGYEKLTTLTQAISQFKGKPVFIDFWFSTCGPCIAEFGQSGPLKKFLKENGIGLLYISIDSERMEENWKNAIKAHNLEGYHIRAENILHQDMDKTYGIRFFPHYMLVNAKGEIVVKQAKNPSEGEALIEQIKSALNL